MKRPALLALHPDRFGNWHAAVWDAGRQSILDPCRESIKNPIVVGCLPVGRELDDPLPTGPEAGWGGPDQYPAEEDSDEEDE